MINLKTKIWLTICSIVFMFSFFTLFYFPQQQGDLLVSNYENEVQNLANTVALGVKIAINEQNFEGVQTAMEFVKGDQRLQFISMLQSDTVWNATHDKFEIKQTVFKTFPENQKLGASITSNDSLIVKKSDFKTGMMSGAILLGFNTKGIEASKEKIKHTSIIVSSLVLLFGILIGFWLAKTISVPVLALRDAARKVGEGDLNQKIKRIHRDEIGQLEKAFNKMLDDLTKTTSDLNEKNVALSNTNEALSSTMVELKHTHAQLIQSEKMASLGELTAGIAHEIQNPLNFVNNFSEVSIELIGEIKEERDKPAQERDESLEVELLDDISRNLAKITHHGKRADAIVKGMLQHSRTTSSEKEPTDINTLSDEYLRLAYHGLRAKDKSFNATLVTNFDKSIKTVNMVPQDMGRVVLNLITNAFYAVDEKKKRGIEGYEPTVSLSTKSHGDFITISVKDNADGIPQTVIDKIFQPFFTTKPTGQGTGLGLSLAYDIVKAHDGKLSVETKMGEGSEFHIELPVD
ncbi:ATP-binding protein [Flavobacterium sp.]|uniref:sensor histidine kinase n=1 Tax=Flavobacterium sp. TaxID=239 RepID=UPI0025BAA955|nr:ATP-binding protein [Flavobacterium sp.]